ncbi:MAG: Trm112 family protein [Gemmatimonadota bacterium]|nr:Trm112 family protein [Gemmatimonadota bacterium]MEC9317363.1 Trm112 family protein [Gemmatimonadota bacterium]|tara:strand:+ start:512 stop:778 length:267 start_codon:yes stop_codon:yes gene_type:complete
MLDPELLEILVCPETKQPIRLADPAVVQKLNVAIAEGSVSNKGGEPVSEKIEEGLIREDDRCLYPIRDDIPIMLIDSAIPLSTDMASD